MRQKNHGVYVIRTALWVETDQGNRPSQQKVYIQHSLPASYSMSQKKMDTSNATCKVTNAEVILLVPPKLR